MCGLLQIYGFQRWAVHNTVCFSDGNDTAVTMQKMLVSLSSGVRWTRALRWTARHIHLWSIQLNIDTTTIESHFLISCPFFSPIIPIKQRCIAELAAADAQQKPPTELATVMAPAVGNSQLGSDVTLITATTKQRDRSSRKSSTTGPATVLHNGSRASSTGSAAAAAAAKRNSKDDSNNLYSGGSTRVPLTSTNMTQSLDASVTSPPQSVAIVAGRKYIMVPKMATMSVTTNVVANGSNDS